MFEKLTISLLQISVQDMYENMVFSDRMDRTGMPLIPAFLYLIHNGAVAEFRNPYRQTWHGRQFIFNCHLILFFFVFLFKLYLYTFKLRSLCLPLNIKHLNIFIAIITNAKYIFFNQTN
jgi:hypothetical protein